MNDEIISHITALAKQFNFKIKIFDSMFIIESKYDIWKIFYNPNLTRIPLYHKNKNNKLCHLQKLYLFGKSMLYFIFNDINNHDIYVGNNRRNT